jgi:hypothetical protein
MFTDEEIRNQATGNMIRKYCNCGILIWEVPSKRFLPRYEEKIICPKCGADHSRKAPMGYRIRHAFRKSKLKLVAKVLR